MRVPRWREVIAQECSAIMRRYLVYHVRCCGVKITDELYWLRNGCTGYYELSEY